VQVQVQVEMTYGRGAWCAASLRRLDPVQTVSARK
jgi:hypothetical protein